MYIHKTYCISPQQDPLQHQLELINEPVDKKLLAIEPVYEQIPPGILRRMGKSIRMGVGTALPLIDQENPLDGFIIGSANAGLDECVKFLIQIVDYEEGQLTPGNFVQSTGNVIAGQLGLITKNKGYNITHMHQGLAFENALIDALMQLNKNPASTYLLGGVDEISPFHYNIETLNGAYKKEDLSNLVLYESGTSGSLPGEGAAMFVVSTKKEDAIARVISAQTIHTNNVELVKTQLKKFLDSNLPPGEDIDLLVSGENGDSRTLPFYLACESLLNDATGIVRYKHLCGDFATAPAIGLWYVCQLLQNEVMPAHMLKRNPTGNNYRNILLYNNFKGEQHGFVLLSAGQV